MSTTTTEPSVSLVTSQMPSMNRRSGSALVPSVLSLEVRWRAAMSLTMSAILVDPPLASRHRELPDRQDILAAGELAQRPQIARDRIVPFLVALVHAQERARPQE